MMIISKFRDYYDKVASNGIDKTLIYKREERSVKFEPGFRIRKWTYYENGIYYAARGAAVAFCGKLYLGFSFETWHESRKSYRDTPPDTQEFLWGEQALERLKSFDKKESKTSEKKRWVVLNNLFNTLNEKPYEKLFLTERIPLYFFYPPEDYYWSFRKETGCTAILNCNLEEKSFFKKIDTYTAFQEISMYIGGVLGMPDKPTVEISDTDRLLSKGFDKKWSFRNPDPPKRKR